MSPENPIVSAQVFKKDFLQQSEGESVVVSSSLVSLAFGISKGDLGRLCGKSLIIAPLDEENVRISLRASSASWEKVLWGKMLDELKEELLSKIERKQTSKAKRTYEFLCLVYQATLQARESVLRGVKLPEDLKENEEFARFWEELKSGKAGMEGNREFLEGLMCCLWQGLAERTRSEVYSPVQIRNALGIIGSGE